MLKALMAKPSGIWVRLHLPVHADARLPPGFEMARREDHLTDLQRLPRVSQVPLLVKFAWCEKLPAFSHPSHDLRTGW